MSLERKDIRAKLDPDDHADLLDLCQVEGIEISEFVEREVLAAVRAKIHDATLLAERLAHRGRSGIVRESANEAPERHLPFAAVRK